MSLHLTPSHSSTGHWASLSTVQSFHLPLCKLGVNLCTCTGLLEELEHVADSLETPQSPQVQGVGVPVCLRKQGIFLSEENNLNHTLWFEHLPGMGLAAPGTWCMEFHSRTQIYVFPIATITKYHQLVAYDNTNWFSYSSRRQKAKVRVWPELWD